MSDTLKHAHPHKKKTLTLTHLPCKIPIPQISLITWVGTRTPTVNHHFILPNEESGMLVYRVHGGTKKKETKRQNQDVCGGRKKKK